MAFWIVEKDVRSAAECPLGAARFSPPAAVGPTLLRPPREQRGARKYEGRKHCLACLAYGVSVDSLLRKRKGVVRLEYFSAF